MTKRTLTVGNKAFTLDELGCLEHFYDWQPEFAEALAEEVGITPPLTDAHIRIIAYLREEVIRTGRTPIVHRTCRDNDIRLRDMERLFPAGFHRGACKLAGLNYFDRHTSRGESAEKIYRIDGRGFLVDPAEWDEAFAAMRAEELGLELSERHWAIIRHLRQAHSETKAVPTVFEVSRQFSLEDEELEGLFPRGYQRSAVKIAGLTLAR